MGGVDDERAKQSFQANTRFKGQIKEHVKKWYLTITCT